MRRFLPLAFAVLAINGCGSSELVPPDPPLSSEINGSIDPGSGNFALTVGLANSDAGPVEGPLELRGSNLRYDDAVGALSVDLTVTNTGGDSHPLPVRLAFVHLIPSRVAVVDPDVHIGDHAAVEFSFANEDLSWTPGEKSEPRTVLFTVETAVAVGFVAELNVGPMPTGVIGGIVWDDANRDGVRQGWEPGIADVPVVLRDIGEGEAFPTSNARETQTAENGMYRFENLRAGTYRVAKIDRSDHPYESTTPDEIDVLLPVDSGGKPVVFEANFGCAFAGVDAGDFLELEGYYDIGQPPKNGAAATSPQFVATKMRWIDCTGNDGACTDPGCPCGDRPIEMICSSVWSIDETRVNMLGQYFYLPEKPVGINLDWNVGDRVCMRFVLGSDGRRTILSMDAYEAADDMIHGVVDAVYASGGGTSNLSCASVIICIGYCAPRPR